VAKGSSDFTLPEDADKRIKALNRKSLLMTCWVGRTLCIATKLSTADAMSKMLSLTRRSPSKVDNKGLRAVLAKTDLKDWAFRWHVDVEIILNAVRAQMKDDASGARSMEAVLSLLGADKIRGLGGTEGYADNVYTRMTYLDAPGTDRGIVRVFKRGGSYKKALAMTPEGCTFFLAAQIDTQALTKMVHGLVRVATGQAEKEVPRPPVLLREGAKAPAAAKKAPTTAPAGKLDKKTQAVLKQFDLLAEASDGNVSVFLTSVQAMMGMMMGGGPPIGGVLGLTDPVKATKAIDELVKLAELDDEDEEEDEDAKARPKLYRKVNIRHVGDEFSIAIMKDRAIFAMSDSAMKSAIDTALDDTGGFAPDSKAAALAKLTGDGSALFAIDLAGMTKALWPMLVQLAGKADASGEPFPFTSVPSTNKMVRMLGYELAVVVPDEDGLLMKSRGKIPFTTKTVFAYPLMMIMMMGF